MRSEIFLPILKKQLKRAPKGNFRVVKICRWKKPQVIENSPVVDGKPFPTLFWLTCPHLVREVSKLEEKGFIDLFEERLKKDERFRRKYLYAHQFERMLRKAKLPEKLPANLKLKLLKVGVGGIENPLGVKCLHLHLADYVGGVPNPIGREVLRLISSVECSDDYCKKL